MTELQVENICGLLILELILIMSSGELFGLARAIARLRHEGAEMIDVLDRFTHPSIRLLNRRCFTNLSEGIKKILLTIDYASDLMSLDLLSSSTAENMFNILTLTGETFSSLRMHINTPEFMARRALPFSDRIRSSFLICLELREYRTTLRSLHR